MTQRTLKIFPDDMDEIADLAECKVLASDADGKPGFVNGKNLVVPTPPTSGSATLRSVNGVIKWVAD